jgi:hypothetical protein
MLRARSLTRGPWELNRWCYEPSSQTWVLEYGAGDKPYVSTEMGSDYAGDYRYMLRARAQSVGNWERFIVYCIGTGGDFGFQSLTSGGFVSTEMHYPDGDHYMLRARGLQISTWERY